MRWARPLQGLLALLRNRTDDVECFLCLNNSGSLGLAVDVVPAGLPQADGWRNLAAGDRDANPGSLYPRLARSTLCG